jgi:Domain of unknown function (DUF4304)
LTAFNGIAEILAMTAHDDLMMESLKACLLPGLRERGFGGSFPHLRRERPGRIDYVMIQFRRGGGSFTINIGQSGPKGLTEGPWAELPVEKLTVGHLNTRNRVSTGFSGGQWFEYGPRSYDDSKAAKPAEFYTRLAEKALQRFDKDAEPWFAKPRAR